MLTDTKYATKILAALGSLGVNFTVNGIDTIASVHNIIRKNTQMLPGDRADGTPGIKTMPVGATKIQLPMNQAVLAEKTTSSYCEPLSNDKNSKKGMYTLTIKFRINNPKIKNMKYFIGIDCLDMLI